MYYKVFTPDEIKDMRNKQNLSQEKFADLLGISVITLRMWEQGRRKPRPAANTLLMVAKHHPSVLYRITGM